MIVSSTLKYLMGSTYPVKGQPPEPSSRFHTVVGTPEHLDSRALEITKSHQSCKRYPPTMSILANNSTISLRPSTLIFLLQLQIPFSVIMIQGLSSRVNNAPTGHNIRMQYMQNFPRLIKGRYSCKQHQHLPKCSPWNSNGFSSENGMGTMRWWDTRKGS
jgi:hypothetical protein